MLRIVSPCRAWPPRSRAVPGTSFAQSLADVARESTATRTEQRKPVKVYTNDNLKTDITPSSPVASSSADDLTSADASGAMTPADGSAPADAASSGPVTDARDQRSKDEAAWRARITAARESLDRSTSFASALQTQDQRPHHRLRQPRRSGAAGADRTAAAEGRRGTRAHPARDRVQPQGHRRHRRRSAQGRRAGRLAAFVTGRALAP